jgi:ribose 1,5-bisphosphate isomerase
LRIQGASQIEKKAKDALLSDLKKLKGSYGAVKKELVQVLIDFWNARPTEPALRSNIYVIYLFIMGDKLKTTPNLSKLLIDYLTKGKVEKEQGMKKIAKEFVSFFDKEQVVFTHCHSHTVEFAIKELDKNGLLKYVINTETRPAYQGRITAENLTKAGIKVKHTVDSGAYNLMHEADVFITGCDNILANGAIINKVGTRSISNIAEQHGVPHYVLTHINKFDPLSLYTDKYDLELRDPKELWDYKNKKLEIVNYAFDYVPAHLLNLFFTDKGKFDPYSLGTYYVEHAKAYKYKELFDFFKKK